MVDGRRAKPGENAQKRQHEGGAADDFPGGTRVASEFSGFLPAGPVAPASAGARTQQTGHFGSPGLVLFGFDDFPGATWAGRRILLHHSPFALGSST